MLHAVFLAIDVGYQMSAAWVKKIVGANILPNSLNAGGTSASLRKAAAVSAHGAGASGTSWSATCKLADMGGFSSMQAECQAVTVDE